MYRTILVPLDGSLIAERVVPYAQTIARASGARILLLRAVLAHPVHSGDTGPNQREAMREAEDYLKHVVAQLETDTPIETIVDYGEASEVILQEVRERHADLLVMSTHGRSGLGRWIYGSVADKVMRHADVPVLLIPATCDCVWPGGRAFRIMVPLDGSDFAEEALGPASEFAEMLSAEMLLLRIVEPIAYAYVGSYPYLPFDPEADLAAARRYLEGVASRLRSDGRAVEVRSVVGPPALMIATIAREQRANAIAIATHGTGGLSRLVMGSVATGVFQRSTVPILIVRPAAVREASSAPERATHEESITGPPVSVTLTPQELEFVEDGLERLLESSAPDEHRRGEIRGLLHKVTQAKVPSHSLVG